VIAKGLSGAPRGETAFGISAAKKDLATAVQFAASMHAALPVASSALACFEEAEAAFTLVQVNELVAAAHSFRVPVVVHMRLSDRLRVDGMPRVLKSQ